MLVAVIALPCRDFSLPPCNDGTSLAGTVEVADRSRVHHFALVLTPIFGEPREELGLGSRINRQLHLINSLDFISISYAQVDRMPVFFQRLIASQTEGRGTVAATARRHSKLGRRRGRASHSPGAELLLFFAEAFLILEFF